MAAQPTSGGGELRARALAGVVAGGEVARSQRAVAVMGVVVLDDDQRGGRHQVNERCLRDHHLGNGECRIADHVAGNDLAEADSIRLLGADGDAGLEDAEGRVQILGRLLDVGQRSLLAAGAEGGEHGLVAVGIDGTNLLQELTELGEVLRLVGVGFGLRFVGLDLFAVRDDLGSRVTDVGLGLVDGRHDRREIRPRCGRRVHDDRCGSRRSGRSGQQRSGCDAAQVQGQFRIHG